jgi:hypothetical protein
VDAHEKRLTDKYNKAVDRLNQVRKGDPAHIPAAAAVSATLRALRKYQADKKKFDATRKSR